MYNIIRYSSSDKTAWNEFVATSRQGTFLIDRNYMDYHADRFTDHSLMFYDAKGRLRALLPANEKDGTLWSHQGLTYGGLITDERMTAADTVVLFEELNSYLRSKGIKRVVYKAIPWIYHRLPAEEDLYAIFRTCDAKLMARDISSTIILENRIRFAELRRRCVKKAIKANIEVHESNDFESFWNILNTNLTNKYHVTPVHSKKELRLLQSRFPDCIKLYCALMGSEMLAGVVVFLTPTTIHTQYISASVNGKSRGALDIVFDHLINRSDFQQPYFDFGKSTEDCGHILNESLIYQKEGFGGRAVCYDTYEWNSF